MAAIYRIYVKGHLDPNWAAWFYNLNLTQQADGTTILEGPLRDQAALYGLILKLRDLGVTLLFVNCIGRVSKEDSYTSREADDSLEAHK